jgi:uncharacterized membrane protein
MEIAITWILFAFIVGLIASAKTIGFWGGFLLSLLLSPVLGIIIVILSTSKSHRINQIEEQKRQTELLQTMANGQFSVAAEIEKLKQLLDRGAITQEEFDSQKGKLLQKV